MDSSSAEVMWKLTVWLPAALPSKAFTKFQGLVVFGGLAAPDRQNVGGGTLSFGGMPQTWRGELGALRGQVGPFFRAS